jgi:hypothetical protein
MKDIPHGDETFLGVSAYLDGGRPSLNGRYP